VAKIILIANWVELGRFWWTRLTLLSIRLNKI